MSKKAFLIALVCITFGMQAVFAQETFTWHLAVVKDGQGMPFEKSVAIKDGEVFSVEINSEKNCYVYLVIEQASGSMTALLSQPLRSGDPVKISLKLSPPSGQEKFHVVTSLREQKNLQTAIDNFKKEKTSQTTQALKTRLFAISSGGENRPGIVGVSFAGSVRGGETTLGTEYSGADVYSKTIVINH